MSTEEDHLLARCHSVERNLGLQLRISELEREIFRRDLKALRKVQKRRRLDLLRGLAEIDQVTAAVTLKIENRGPIG